MAKEMLINVSEGEECRIALVEDGKLEELYMERSSSTSHVGNIYKGKVTNVEPSIQAAFVDFGLGRNGFLHISDLMPYYFGRQGDDIKESVGRKMARRDRPPIQRCLRRGDTIIVQIIKEGIGTKGPTLSTYCSIPGRILVMMPGMTKMGVSRKIEDDEERRRLRQILDALKPPKDVGFIIRTAGIGKTKTEIQRDFTYLTRLWSQILKQQESGPGPMELYTEGDLVSRTVRDVFTTDIDQIVVDNKDVAKRVKDVIKLANPRTKNKVELYTDTVPLFHRYNIERDIEQMYSRHVPLPSGGSLVIDSTEAVVAIDVNSGKFRDHSDAEMTAFKTDMEAADEIPRQLRMRDLGGVIICDFIDLRYERHRRELEKRLHDHLQNDRAKTKVLRMSQFGIIEMTRQRMRPSLKRSIYFDCPHCKGSGLVKTAESMSLDVMRRLAIALNDQRVARVDLAVSPDVNFYLQNRKRFQLANLEMNCKKPVSIRADAGLALDEMKLELFDARDGTVLLPELGMLPQETGHPHRRHQQPTPQGRHGQQQGGRRDQRGGARPNQPPRPEKEMDGIDERFDLERVEDDVDAREEVREEADVPMAQPQIAEEEAAPEEAPAVAARPQRAPPRPPQRQPQRPPERPQRGRRQEADADEEESNTIEVDEGDNSIGEGPTEAVGEDSRRDGGGGGGGRRRRRRGGRGRGRNRQDGQQQPAGNQPPRGPHPANRQGNQPPVQPRDSGGEPEERDEQDDRAEAELDEHDDRVEPGERDERGEHNVRAQHDEREDQPEVRSDDLDGNVVGPEGLFDEQPAAPKPQARPRRGRQAPLRQPVAPKNAEPDAAEEAIDEAGAPAAEGAETGEPAGEGEETGRRRRRRRGGRRHRRGRAGAQNGDAVEGEIAEPSGEAPASGPESASETEPAELEGREPAPEPEPPKTRSHEPRHHEPAPIPVVPVVRTGSTDRHLIGDEPIISDPPRRPRTYRDLDAIPDDLD